MPAEKDRPRLPPGQFLTRDFPVQHVGLVPHFDRVTWDLRIYGLVEVETTLDPAALAGMPTVTRTLDHHCVTTWSRLDNEWEGVLLSTLLEKARPLPEARFALVHADGGYTTNLPLADLFRDDVLLASRLDGEPLAPEHGHPARLVVPHRYGYKGAKWVRGIELLSEDQPGFWESRGYSNTADPWRDDRFAIDSTD